ncbi:MAG: hypothetical protein QNJ97_18750 [Myxococcota bacterium]|nr:hypothetical protein [Myxococcota bacterium]
MRQFWPLIPILIAGCTRESSKQDVPTSEAIVLETQIDTDHGDAPSSSGIETAGNIGLIRVDVDGFRSLSLNEKKIIYFYYLATLGIERFVNAQRNPEIQMVAQVLKGIVRAEGELPGPIRGKILPFAKRVLLYPDILDPENGVHLTPAFIPGELAAAAQVALKKGIDLGMDQLPGLALGATRLERLEALLKTIRPLIFNRDAEAVPDGGILYTTPADRESTAAIETEIIAYLKSAMPLTKGNERAAMQHLVAFLSTGDTATLASYRDTEVDAVSNVYFIPEFSHGDDVDPKTNPPEGAQVIIRHHKIQALAQKVAALAGYFEQRMPWIGDFKRTATEAMPTPVQLFQRVALAAGRKPRYAAPSVLPGTLAAHIDHRGMRFFLVNIAEALSAAVLPLIIREYALDKTIAARRTQCRTEVWVAHLLLSEVIGQSAGKAAKGLRRPPEVVLGQLFKPLLALRKNLVALYLAGDPKVREMGLISSNDCAKAMYDSYTSAALEHLSWEPASSPPATRSDQTRRTIAHYLMERKVLEIVEKNGHFYSRILDYQEMTRSIGEWLADVQRILSTGDIDAATRLLADRGPIVDAVGQADVRARYAALGLPEEIALMLPVLKPSVGKGSTVLDVSAAPFQTFFERVNLVEQMGK